MKTEMRVQVLSYVHVQYGEFTATRSTLWSHAHERMALLEMKGYRTTTINGVEKQVRDSLIRECTVGEVREWIERHIAFSVGDSPGEG